MFRAYEVRFRGPSLTALALEKTLGRESRLET